MGGGPPREEQHEATREVLESVREFLGGPARDDDAWSFAFGEHLESNWGAVYGGALAAATLAVARQVAPDRSPRSLHIQMVRSVPRGRAGVTANVRHAGRTVGSVEVELSDARGKLAAIALCTMVTPDAVAADYDNTAATPFQVTSRPVIAGVESWVPPVSEMLGMQSRRNGEPVRLIAANVRPSVDGSAAGVVECTVPWTNLALTGPEAACLAADAAVALPIINSYVPVDAIGPNADLTLRFTTAPATRVVNAAATMLSVQRGTATVGIEVHGGDRQLAHGLATSLLLVRESAVE